MAVASLPKTSELAFSCPKIGPKVYITTGPSGWPETFKRKDVDQKLGAFVYALAPTVELGALVDMFIMSRQVIEKPEPTNWFTVIGYLARVLAISPRDIPHECGVAYWGLIVLATIEHEGN